MIIGRSSSHRAWFKYRSSVPMIVNRLRLVCFRFIGACLCLVPISSFGSSLIGDEWVYFDLELHVMDQFEFGSNFEVRFKSGLCGHQWAR